MTDETRDADETVRQDDGGTEAAGADTEASKTPRADGGTVDDVALDPWGSSSVSDYRKLFEEFGIEEFDEVLPEVPAPHYLMRRGVIFGHRDYRPVAEAMRNDEPFAALSGFMPTGDPHIGHKLVFDEIIWHQQQGGDAHALIADLEAHSARGLTWKEIDEHARDYVLSLLALGFDPEDGTLYRQSTNREVQDLAFELGSEARFSEFQGIYGFDGETDVSHMQSVVTQMADILYPQLDEPKPTVIPVGPDQDPHVRLARDLAARMRFFKVTEAFASFELADERERALVGWFYDAVETAIESGLGMETKRVDADEADLGNVTCEQAAILISELRDAVANADDTTVDLSDVNVDVVEIERAGYDLSENEWSEIIDALLPLDAKTLRQTDDETIESTLDKLHSGGKEPLQRRTRFVAQHADDEAFDALIEAIDGEKRVYDEHADSFDLDRDVAEELARDVELDNGGYGFVPPSSIYHRFMTGLTGGKMSSSVPASHISLLDDPEEGYDKVKSATTGGRETAEKQRELGGKADECPVYELYAYLLSGDDDEFAKEVYDECVTGERLCGGCKEQAAELMEEFLEDHQDKREEWAEKLDEVDIDLNSARKRV
ncbi:tryptophan--tRNA ligase [Halostella pelagica]|uniref:tryptophan--tRNA ligase n=1 Tax=Halostella pelagica TaxID=2583824 RepID=UPI0010810515|nr:tryptophan--tRNA ligase [Halostella pelagica]